MNVVNLSAPLHSGPLSHPCPLPLSLRRPPACMPARLPATMRALWVSRIMAMPCFRSPVPPAGVSGHTCVCLCLSAVPPACGRVVFCGPDLWRPLFAAAMPRKCLLVRSLAQCCKTHRMRRAVRAPAAVWLCVAVICAENNRVSANGCLLKLYAVASKA